MRKLWAYEVRSVNAEPIIPALGWRCAIKRVIMQRWGFEVCRTIHHMYGDSPEQALSHAISWVERYGEVTAL